MRSRSQIRILELLHDSRKELTTREIQDGVEISYAMVTRHLRELTNKKAVLRRALDNGYSYKFKQWPDENKEFESVTSTVARSTIATLTHPQWQPKISKPEEWRKVPEVFIGLNALLVKYSQGERIKQSDLDSLKAELRSVMRTIENFREALGRLLTTEDLWDAQLLGPFLSSGEVLA